MTANTRAQLEVVPTTPSHSFAVREFRLPRFTSPWHFHPECELTYIVQSTGKRFVGDSIGSFGPGDLVLVGARLPHYWWNDGPGKSAGAEAHSIVIQFREDCLGADWLAKPELAPVRRLLGRARRGLWFTASVSGKVGPIMRRMGSLAALDRLIALFTIFKTLLEAEDYRVLSSRGFSPWLDECTQERVNRVYQYVFAHFPEPLDHQRIAREAGLSLSALGHYLKKVTGRTLSDFIKEVRIGHARRLLVDTDRTVAEIAFASGYETLSNFNRRFHELAGMSPTEFRRLHATAAG